MDQLLSPKQVAQAIGVSEASLKRWCDKGLVRAVRTAGGHRRLAVADVCEFLRRTGRRPLHADLLRLPVVRAATGDTIEAAADRFEESLAAGDEAVAQRIVFDLYLAKTSVSDLGDRLVGEAMRRLGERWSDHELEPYQERRACEICGRILSQLRAVLPTLPESAPPAIGGTLYGDAYRLPTSLVELALREAGWRAESLGTGLPAETFAAAIGTLHPKLFWLSVSFIGSVPEFLAAYNLIYQRSQELGVPIAVGGQALRADIRRQMHYSAFCDSLRHLQNFVASMSPVKQVTV
jgi:excisionase family DNA binding protein